MPRRRFERITLAQLLLSGTQWCLVPASSSTIHMHNRGMCLRLGRCRPPFSIRPVPIRCRNRHTGRSRRRHRGPLPDIPDMWLRRRWVNACRARPFALGHGHQPQKTTRSTTGVAPRSSVQHRSLIPIITILSGMAMVAPGSGPGTDIGYEHRPVRDRWTIYLASVFSQRMR